MTRAGLILILVFLASCVSKAPKEEARPQAVNEQAPGQYRVRLTTTKGDVLIEVTRAWAPHGADRFYNLVKTGFYDGARFFRVLYGYVAQFGLKGDPNVDRVWAEAIIADDPRTQSNRLGTVSFAKSGPRSRTTQVFINLRDNQALDSQDFAPFGRVVEGMDVVERLYKGYGDAPPRGNGPDQLRIRMQGNEYLERDFPRLDSIREAVIE